MAIEDEAFSFVTNQIGQIIVILGFLIAAFRWLDKRNELKVESALVRLLGDNKDGRGGIIGSLLGDINNDISLSRRQTRSLRQKFSLIIRYLASDVKRIDVATEKIANKQGIHYSKSERNYEQQEREIEDSTNDDNDQENDLL